MDQDHFNHILCSEHQLPINRIIKQKKINSSKRGLCYKCAGEGTSLFQIYQILDTLQVIFLPIHQTYSKFRNRIQVLKSEINNIIDKALTSIEGTIDQSEFELTQLEKYLNYRKNYNEFTQDDLEIISNFIYNGEPEESPLVKATKLARDFEQNWKNQMVLLFEMIIKLIKGTGFSSNPSVVQPPLQQTSVQKSIIIGNNSLSYVKKNEFKTSLVSAAIFNQNGNTLIQGQYPYNCSNLEIKSIEQNFEIKSQQVQQEIDENSQEQATALAFNESNSLLFVGYENGNISTYQYTKNIWNKKDHCNAHYGRINFLIVNQIHTQIISVGGYDSIKCFQYQDGIMPSRKEIDSIHKIIDIQINKECDQLYVIGDGKLHILSNSKDFFSQLQQISLENQQATCITTANKQIYIGSNVGNIYIYEQKNRHIFEQVCTSNLIKKSLLQIKYYEENKLLIVLLDKQVRIHQKGSNNQFVQIQEITGEYSMICFQNNQKSSQIILYCQDQYMGIHYIMQRK
ncbi:unnamed protein product (macronuclear) [Paramecium tetraurelia]|uniref:Uncharacterized protein n=1 Tax=Paramecium tetraurelia TaxID=5888 RepID=A0E1T2_PARTE|nr:uncharacterized protein GSPATT00022420001 [Paramecium tetraurelia]CAK89249.1 unnamed protein product [Paramecium tetraurelia]|eukprot:XP_001456646.1 hypothetical protein (macronuclear) [Paramecium tetraurelia strain d4-2]